MLSLATGASATNLEFQRWQFGEFAATLRYLQYGIATEGINDIYAREIKNFIPADHVRTAMLCPEETKGTLAGEWTFFGARFLPLPSTDGKPSFYAMSYLGGAVGFHNGAGFDALINPSDVQAAADHGACLQKNSGVLKAYLQRWGYSHLTRSSHFAPLSWNSLDIDGDSKGDFSFGGQLHLSSSGYKPIVDKRIGAEVAFVRTDRGVRLARLHNKTLYVERLDKGVLKVEYIKRLSDVAVNAGHALTVLPGDSNDTDFVAVRTSCGIQAYRPMKSRLHSVTCISGLKGNWAMPGARGDFDGDGIDDFWISQTSHGAPVSARADSVRLVSGAAWRGARRSVSLDSLTFAEVKGSPRYSDYDGIATTLSPYAGDIDGDGRPDLTFSGHRHMNEAGVLYVLLGKDVANGLETNIEDARILKIAGPLMSQLAPPFHHWDATDWDGDGHDDIVVTADNDSRSGLNAGAVYVLSGARIIAGR